jgi:hypothetical protein
MKNKVPINDIIQEININNTPNHIQDNKIDPETPKYRFQAMNNRRKLKSSLRITFYGQPNNDGEQEDIKKDSIRKHVSGLRR